MNAETVGFAVLAVCAVGFVVVAIVLIVSLRRQWRVRAAVDVAQRLLEEGSFLLALRMLAEADREHELIPEGDHTAKAEAIATELLIVRKSEECVARVSGARVPEFQPLIEELEGLLLLFVQEKNFLIDGRSMVWEAAVEYVERVERAYVLREQFRLEIATILAAKS